LPDPALALVDEPPPVGASVVLTDTIAPWALVTVVVTVPFGLVTLVVVVLLLALLDPPPPPPPPPAGLAPEGAGLGGGAELAVGPLGIAPMPLMDLRLD
jgi:hypothetical protein